MVRRIARNVLAGVCLVIGIAGLFLPFIQGIAMIVLAIIIADFEAKERILERYRHTRIGAHLWRHHVARKAKETARAVRAHGFVPESGPAPRATGESSSETE